MLNPRSPVLTAFCLLKFPAVAQHLQHVLWDAHIDEPLAAISAF